MPDFSDSEDESISNNEKIKCLISLNIDLFYKFKFLSYLKVNYILNDKVGYNHILNDKSWLHPE